MTDLDKLWQSFPTSKPPVAQILMRARSATPRPPRRPARRLALVGMTVAAVAGAFVAGQLVDRPGGGAGRLSAAGIRPAAFRADLHPATSCDQLLASYRDRGSALVSAWGWGGQLEGLPGGRGVASDSVPSTGLLAQAAPAPATPDSVGNSATGTNVQEVGVDEPDVAKTDGKLLARIDDATLTLYDVSGAQVRQTSEINLPNFTGGEIFLVGKTIVAVGRDTVTPEGSGAPGSRVETVSVSDPTQPSIVSNISYSAGLASSRQHGSAVRLVLSSGLPPLKFVQPDAGRSVNDALAANRAIVRKSTLADWLPTYDAGHGRQPLLDCGNVALPPDGVQLGTMSIVGFDAAATTARDAIGLAGVTDIAYESGSHLYLANETRPAFCSPSIACPLASNGAVRQPVPFGDSTTIFQFDLDGYRSSHVASGRVTGFLANRWSMSESGDVLRVAVTTRGQTSQVSSIVTFGREGQKLVENGRLDGLGEGETLTAARWFDNLAILSTAKQTDPLYTIDLSDPGRPKLLGSLHIPGFTTYLHPIGNGRLLAVGQAGALASKGGPPLVPRAGGPQAQVGLFDISDLSNVRQLAVSLLPPETWPMAGADPRAFSWFQNRSEAFTAFVRGDGTVFVGQFGVGASTLSEREIPVPGLAAKGDARTMELPDHRVLLIGGANVSFIPAS